MISIRPYGDPDSSALRYCDLDSSVRDLDSVQTQRAALRANSAQLCIHMTGLCIDLDSSVKGRMECRVGERWDAERGREREVGVECRVVNNPPCA